MNIAILNKMDAADLEDFFDFLMDSLSKLKEEEAAEDDCPAKDDYFAGDGDPAGDDYLADDGDPAGDEYFVIDEEPAANDAADADTDTADTTGNSGTNDNGDKYVAVIFPGETPRLEKYGDCDPLLDRFGNHMAVWQIPEGKNLGVIYDRRRVLDIDGENYLLGPVIVYCSNEDFSEISAMESEDYLKIRRILNDRTVTFEAEPHEFRVIRM